MAITRRVLLLASSASLLLLIAISLATAIEIRAPLPQLFQHAVAQAVQVDASNQKVGAAKAKLNGTDFDRGDIWHGTSLVPGSVVTKPLPSAMTNTEEGMLGATPTPRPTPSWDADGVLGPNHTPTPSPLPVAPKPVPPVAQMPIVAMSYAGSGGPKHCRGKMIQKMQFARPIDNWRNGTCIDLPSEARCGIFWSAKGDNCEARLYNVPKCHDTARTYVNTVVFMPEERPVGALWQSMKVSCGVDVPEAKLIDPAVLGGLLKPKPKPGGG